MQLPNIRYLLKTLPYKCFTSWTTRHNDKQQFHTATTLRDLKAIKHLLFSHTHGLASLPPIHKLLLAVLDSNSVRRNDCRPRVSILASVCPVVSSHFNLAKSHWTSSSSLMKKQLVPYWRLSMGHGAVYKSTNLCHIDAILMFVYTICYRNRGKKCTGDNIIHRK